jgi:hypothetical protein
MRPERINNTGFIRRHCGSVTIKAPSGRATGAQRHCFIQVPSVHLQWSGTRFHFYHPAGKAIPSGTCFLRVFNP